MQLTRHQLRYRLLKEKPWLRLDTGEFREQFILRAIYEVGHDPQTLSNYVGMRKEYVMAVCIKYRTKAVKAAKDFINGKQAPFSVMDQVKGIGTAIAEKFRRRKALSMMRKGASMSLRRRAV